MKKSYKNEIEQFLSELKVGDRIIRKTVNVEKLVAAFVDALAATERRVREENRETVQYLRMALVEIEREDGADERPFVVEVRKHLASLDTPEHDCEEFHKASWASWTTCGACGLPRHQSNQSPTN